MNILEQNKLLVLERNGSFERAGILLEGDQILITNGAINEIQCVQSGSATELLRAQAESYSSSSEYTHFVTERYCPHGIGNFYPDIYRPVLHNNYGRAIPHFTNKSLYETIANLRRLHENLNSLFGYIDPKQENFFATGPEIRNYIFACVSSIETIFNRVLNFHAPKNKKQNNNIRDYFKLEEFMKLTEYKLSFIDYPELNSFTPFDWTTEKNSPNWYKSYSKGKHDIEKYGSELNLGCAINAFMAFCAVTLAVHGRLSTTDYVGDMLIRVDCLSKPVWNPEEQYIPINGKLVPVQFTPSAA